MLLNGLGKSESYYYYYYGGSGNGNGNGNGDGFAAGTLNGSSPSGLRGKRHRRDRV